MSSGYWRAACINMVLAIVTTVLIERSADPFWYEVPAPLKLIFWLFFNIYYIKSVEFKTPLSVCYPLVTTPWLWFYLSRVSFALTISVAFIVSWCLMFIYSLKCSTKNTRPRTSQLGIILPLCDITHLYTAICSDLHASSFQEEDNPF